ncbi:MAG: class II aldolase/adducin family protein [Proteobacteria bacterium]|nr:class II aldolase/adducin family protein [Pseudomonadota bacterium]
MTQTVELRAALRDLVIANRILAREGVIDGFGHISIRHPGDPKRYFLSRSRSPELVTIDDLMEFALDNEPIDQRGRAMYAERPIHGSLYAARSDINSVCHNHAHSLIPFGVTGTKLRPIIHMAAMIGAEVPIWDIRDEFGDTNLLVTTREQGNSLARGVGAGRVALMRGHGATVGGRTVRETVFTAIYLQVNAGLLLQARNLGEVKGLSPGEIKLTADALSGALSQDRAWEYWSSRAGFSGV